MKHGFSIVMLIFVLTTGGFAGEETSKTSGSAVIEGLTVLSPTPTEEITEIAGSQITVSGTFVLPAGSVGKVKAVYVALGSSDHFSQAQGTRAWKKTFSKLPDGTHTVHIYGEDSHKRRTVTNRCRFTTRSRLIDISPPIAETVLPSDGNRIPFADFIIAGTATDTNTPASGIRTVHYSLNGEKFKETEGGAAWAIKFSKMKNGKHTLSFYAEDNVGNVSETKSIAFNVDTPPFWTKFISVLGLVVLVGIAYLFSKHRKAIKIRTVVWGLGLQLLFAIIILGKGWVSFGGMFVFIFLILLYIFEEDFKKTTLAPIVIGIITVVAETGGVALSYLLESAGGLHIASFLLVGVGIFYLVSLFLKKGVWAQNAFVGIAVLVLGILVSRGVGGAQIMSFVSGKVSGFLDLVWVGTRFVFGDLAVKEPFRFFIIALPTIIFFSAFMSILYYLGVIQVIVSTMAHFMRWSMRTSGAETISCSANIFVGQTEAPFLIKPFLNDMTKSELHAIMVGGFATIAGGVLAAYIGMGIDAGHLIAASVMSAPAALVIAKILYPETEHSATAGDMELPKVETSKNLVEAAANGTTDGLKLAVNVAAMLIAFLAIIAFVDVLLSWGDKLVDGMLLKGAKSAGGEYGGIFPGSLNTLFGTIFRPIAFVMGVPWQDSAAVGNLLGLKVTANEFVGYLKLSEHVAAAKLMQLGQVGAPATAISARAIIISTYALCGFANFGSIGIQIGGISSLAPKRRSDLAALGIRAMFGGALASWLTATIAGILL